MKQFVVKNGIIENIIVVDDVATSSEEAEGATSSESATPDGYAFYPADGVEGNIGWAWANGSPVKPTVSEADQAERVRSKRDRLLMQSDWTQVADAPVDQAAWATYRQALRDITDQEGFPFEVTYPTQPE